jgi:hypothetical protein
MYYLSNSSMSIWEFVPNDAAVKKWPFFILSELNMDIDEAIYIPGDKGALVDGNLVIATIHGCLVLKSFDKQWVKKNKITKSDFIVWDLFRIIKEFTSD